MNCQLLQLHEPQGSLKYFFLNCSETLFFFACHLLTNIVMVASFGGVPVILTGLSHGGTVHINLVPGLGM